MSDDVRPVVRPFASVCALALGLSIVTACSNAAAPPVSPDLRFDAGAGAGHARTAGGSPGSKACCLFVSYEANVGTNTTVVGAFKNAVPYGLRPGVKKWKRSGLPWALATSPSGVLYVSERITHNVYAFGNGYGKPPTAVYPQDNGSVSGSPWALAVGNDGTLYVADAVADGTSGTSGSYVSDVVRVYPPGSTAPVRTLAGPPGVTSSGQLGVAVDDKNDVYFAVAQRDPLVLRVIEYAAGSSSGKVRTLVGNDGTANTLQSFRTAIAVDAKGNLLIGASDPVRFDKAGIWVFPPKATKPSRFIGPTGTANGGSTTIAAMAYAPELHAIFFTQDQGGPIDEYSYPQGKPLGDSFFNFVVIEGIAVAKGARKK